MPKPRRPYSTKFTARGVPRRYLLSGIPPGLWEAARKKARQDGVAMRSLILSLIEQWVKAAPAAGDRPVG
jgi:predicted HicB family RNase H-like nuclease